MIATSSVIRNVRDYLATVEGLIEIGEGTPIAPLSCIDGRNLRPILGAPGGTAGLFLILLSVLEKRTQQFLSFHSFETLFDKYLDRFGSFYLHSDSKSVKKLIDELELHHSGSLEAWPESERQGLVNPPEVLRPILLRSLTDPEYVGCGHLGLILEKPDTYFVRHELSQSMISVFFGRYWSGDTRVVFEILEGEHEEFCVLDVYSSPPLSSAARVTARIPPSDGSRQVFVHHPDVVSDFLREQALLLVELGLSEEGEVEELVEAQTRLAETHLSATLDALAPHLRLVEAFAEGTSVVVVDR